MQDHNPSRAGTSKEKLKIFQSKTQHCHVPYMSDSMLIPRLKKYLEEENNDLSLVDMDLMVDDLRAKYPEYGRRKRGPFRQGVQNAYDFVCRTCGIMPDVSGRGLTSDMCNISSASVKDAELDEEMDCTRPKDQKAYELRHPAQQNRSRKRSRSDDGEEDLIDISNDEDFKNMPAQKPQNGPTATVSLTKMKQQIPKPMQNNVQTKSIAALTASPATNGRPKKRKKWKEIERSTPAVTLKDFGGCSKVLQEIRKFLNRIRYLKMYNYIGRLPFRGILLYGPPGCGKTLLANAIAGELKMPLMAVTGPELVAGVSGESEERIRDLFDQAAENAPCVLFLDEIDAVTPNRNTTEKEMERRMVAQFLECFDKLGQKEGDEHVVVIGATNRPESMDPALRRAGRFNREICLGIPDKKGRKEILQILCKDLKLAADFDYDYIARNTPGYVGADLMDLTCEAVLIAGDRIIDNLKARKIENKTSEVSDEVPSVDKEITEMLQRLQEANEKNEIQIDLDDCKEAMKSVQPSTTREGFATVPDVTWDDIGSLDDVKKYLKSRILGPLKHPELLAKVGVSAPSGVLLCGPPGCGKTLLAKAVANEAEINFISVKGPELLNMYVGESEKAVRQCFQKARNAVPCVIFFDEFEALCPKRHGSREGGVTVSVVNQLLAEMDGLQKRKGVSLMAASNRPDIIDPAVLRPGRLNKVLYIGLPSPSDRIDILKACTKNGTQPWLDEDVDLKAIGESSRCSGYTGADLAALVEEAGFEAFEEWMGKSGNPEKLRVSNKHFMQALDNIRPSVSKKDLEHYETFRKLYS